MEQYYQGQLSRNDFREAQIDLSISKNRLNQTHNNDSERGFAIPSH